MKTCKMTKIEAVLTVDSKGQILLPKDLGDMALKLVISLWQLLAVMKKGRSAVLFSSRRKLWIKVLRKRSVQC